MLREYAGLPIRAEACARAAGLGTNFADEASDLDALPGNDNPIDSDGRLFGCIPKP